MKFSFSKNSNIQQSIDIIVGNNDIEKKVTSKLTSTQKSAKIKGFRKGRAPMDIIKRIYGEGIRQEIIFDAVKDSFYKQIDDKGIKVVGRPNLSPERIEIGKDVKFKATFEVYPEIKVNNLNKLNYKKLISSISDGDVDKAISDLQKKMSEWNSVDKASSQGDRIRIDFKGTIEGKDFEDNAAEDFVVEIGSKQMIEGFEQGLLNLKKGDRKSLELKFPEEYPKKELASKEVEFNIVVKEVIEAKLCKLNKDFFKKSGIEVDNAEDFKREVRKKLEEDLENILKNKIRRNVFDSLLKNNEFEIPKAMLESEVLRMRADAARNMGLDPKELTEEKLPSDSFSEEAEKRVRVGVLLSKIIEERSIKPDPEKVKKIIEERSSFYKEPQKVVSWFYSNEEQLRNVESVSLEEQVLELIFLEAKAIPEELTFEECINVN